MQVSPPGKKLNPRISVHTAAIYARDPVRYKNLCRWVWTQQKIGWPDEAIAECLRLGNSHIDKAENWWKYLTALVKKAKGRASEQEARKHKTEIAQIAEDFLEFVEQRARDRRPLHSEPGTCPVVLAGTSERRPKRPRPPCPRNGA